MIRRPPRSTPCLSSAASDVYKRQGWGGHPLCLSGDSPVLMDLHWPRDCTAQSSILSIGSVFVVLLLRHFPKWSWTVVAFPCVTFVKSFTSWYALLLLFFLRFSSISLNCSPIQFFFLLFCESLDVVHFLVFLRSFRFESFVSQFSLFVAQIKNICGDPGFFLLTMFAKDLIGCFSHFLPRVSQLRVK